MCRSYRDSSVICKLGKRMGSTKLIRYLNDRFRSTFQGGQIVLTRGIRALPQEEITEILSKVSNFNDFNSSNDPYFEHDCAYLEYKGMKIIWKIDYYDKEYEYASENPADITKTNRVLTVMLADEY